MGLADHAAAYLRGIAADLTQNRAVRETPVKDVRDINQLRPLTLTSQHHAIAKLGLPRLHYGVESSPAWTSVVSASRFKMRPR